MPRALLIAGLGFGDEGKGRLTDALTRRHQAQLVVRYNGGAQAAHRVITPDGRSHVFSQFGSGTLAGASTFLSRYVTLDLPALRREADHLRELGIPDPYARLWVDPDCPVVTPYHRIMNCIRERLRGDGRHGSCGRGIGEVAADREAGRPILTVAGVLDGCTGFLSETRTRFIREAEALGFMPEMDRELYDLLTRTSAGWQADALRVAKQLKISQHPDPVETADTIIFEGAQGVLLDERYGFHPHTTWSNCTFAQAESICVEFGLHVDIKYGVTRTYHTRHGAGPFPSQLPSAPPEWLTHEHNTTGDWQGAFRVGALDLPLLTYACGVAQPDCLAVTHCDVLDNEWPVVHQYRVNPLDAPLRAGLWRGLAYQQAIGGRLQDAGPVVHLVPRAAVLLQMIEATNIPVGWYSLRPYGSGKTGSLAFPQQQTL